MTTEKYTGEIKNCEPEKCEELKWFLLGSLPRNIIPYINEAINNYSNKIFYSEWGF